jgi:hypothetical protein
MNTGFTTVTVAGRIGHPQKGNGRGADTSGKIEWGGVHSDHQVDLPEQGRQFGQAATQPDHRLASGKTRVSVLTTQFAGRAQLTT